MKSNVRIILLILIVVAAQIGCKKKKETESNNVPPSTNTQPFMPSKIDGYMSHSLNFEMENDTLKFSYFLATAAFYNELRDKDSIYFSIGGSDVGKVTLNNMEVSKEFYPGGGTYYFLRPVYETSLAATNNPRNWHITGAGSYKEINFLDNFLAPKYIDPENWPDTIYRSKDNTFNIGNYSGADNVTIFIQDVFNQGHTPIKTLTPPSKTVNFSKEDFFDFSNGGSSYIKVQVTLVKNNYKNIEGKILGFRTELNYLSRAIPIKYD